MQRELERSAPVSGRRAIAATRRTQLGILTFGIRRDASVWRSPSHRGNERLAILN